MRLHEIGPQPAQVVDITMPLVDGILDALDKVGLDYLDDTTNLNITKVSAGQGNWRYEINMTLGHAYHVKMDPNFEPREHEEWELVARRFGNQLERLPMIDGVKVAAREWDGSFTVTARTAAKDWAFHLDTRGMIDDLDYYSRQRRNKHASS